MGEGDAVFIGALSGDEKDVVIYGTIQEVCKVKGCWMTIRDEAVGKEKHEPGTSFTAMREAQEKARKRPHEPKWREAEQREEPQAETLED
jgi:hypothetical protein